MYFAKEHGNTVTDERKRKAENQAYPLPTVLLPSRLLSQKSGIYCRTMLSQHHPSTGSDISGKLISVPAVRLLLTQQWPLNRPTEATTWRPKHQIIKKLY